MRKSALLAAVVCLISCYSINAFGQRVVRYVGPSSLATKGAHAGEAGMNQMCRNTFNGNARMCHVDDFFYSAGIGTSEGQQLWVQPSLSNCVNDGSQVMCQEAGVAIAPVPEANWILDTCSTWTVSAPGSNGATVLYSNTTGWTLTVADCSTSHRVACCIQ